MMETYRLANVPLEVGFFAAREDHVGQVVNLRPGPEGARQSSGPMVSVAAMRYVGQDVILRGGCQPPLSRYSSNPPAHATP
jgi:hypothetical protein